MTGLRRVTSSGDQGSALAIALTFLMVFGLMTGIVLQFATTGQRSTVLLRAQSTATHSGAGAIDGAINQIRSNLNAGIASAGVTTCFTLPAGALDNATAVTVQCSPYSDSGAVAAGADAAQPVRAVTALSATAGEGVTVPSGTTKVRGGVAVNRSLTVASGATLDSSGYRVEARACPGPGSGTVLDSCTTVSGIADPGYAAPDTSTAVQRTSLPACAATVTLQPGIYRSASALQSVLDCPNATIVLASGTYYFDFRDNASHQLVFAGGAPRNSILLGGAVSGTACDPTAAGVDLVFGGDSRLNVQSGKVEVCSLVPQGNTTRQHIVLRGLASNTSVATTGSTAGVSATSVGGVPWLTPGNGAVVDAAVTTTTLGAGSQDAVLRVALPAAVVPPDAQNIGATITVRHGITTTNPDVTSTATLRTPAGATAGTATLATCTPVTNCAGVLRDDTATAITGLSPSQLNGSPTPATVDIRLSKPGGDVAASEIDGLTISLTYDLPIRAVCRLSSPTGGCVAGSVPLSPLLTASGSYATTPLALHGTIYAPTSSVDLGLTSVTATVVDRGIVARHVRLAMTSSAGAPALISIPDITFAPRRLVLVARAGTAALARAEVVLSNPAGTANGSVADVRQWSAN